MSSGSTPASPVFPLPSIPRQLPAGCGSWSHRSPSKSRNTPLHYRAPDHAPRIANIQRPFVSSLIGGTGRGFRGCCRTPPARPVFCPYAVAPPPGPGAGSFAEGRPPSGSSHRRCNRGCPSRPRAPADLASLVTPQPAAKSGWPTGGRHFRSGAGSASWC
jgi:hypothetical protein